MPSPIKKWEVTCDRETFQRIRSEEKFPYVVALARAVNALYAIHSLLPLKPTSDSPARVRNGMNSYFFSSALLYEGLALVRRMKRIFKDDEIFKNGLLTLLKDPVAQRVEQNHLNPARNHAVFHFLPDKFKSAIDKGRDDRQVFIAAVGKKKSLLHYSYADVLAAEMLVGAPSDDPKFWSTFENAAKETSDFVIKFANDAEDLIGNHLKAWGFKRE
jgi:hypothetical protein